MVVLLPAGLCVGKVIWDEVVDVLIGQAGCLIARVHHLCASYHISSFAACEGIISVCFGIACGLHARGPLAPDVVGVGRPSSDAFARAHGPCLHSGQYLL
jgi:hypothetical protein